MELLGEQDLLLIIFLLDFLETLEFPKYNYEEILSILNQRVEYAFVKDVLDKNIIKLIADKTFEKEDLRTGIFLLRESGIIAEMKASRKILLEHTKKALEKLEEFKIKKQEDFGIEEQDILKLVKENSGLSIKELFGLYNGNISYSTFHRKLENLNKNNMISLGDMKDKSLTVHYTKKLDEF